MKEQVKSTIAFIEATPPTHLVDKLKKLGVPPIQIEWEIEEFYLVGQPFHRTATALKKRETKIGHARVGLKSSFRPVLRWYNIVLGSLSCAFPNFGPVKEFDKAVAQILSS